MAPLACEPPAEGRRNFLAATTCNVIETEPGAQEVPERRHHESRPAMDRLVIPRMETTGFLRRWGRGFAASSRNSGQDTYSVIPYYTVTLNVSEERNTAMLHEFQARGHATARGASLKQVLKVEAGAPASSGPPTTQLLVCSSHPGATA